MAHQGSKWCFTAEQLEDSPSRADDVTAAEENALREKTCGFIDKIGVELRLPKIPIATAQTFFHRFFARQSFKKHDRRIIAVTCLFLAAKVEDVPKKLRDTINAYHKIKCRAAGEQVVVDLDPEGEDYWTIKERILIYERIVLQTISFDLNVLHPYKMLLGMVKTIRKSKSFQSTTSSKEFAQVAWNFVNDSLRTSLCLQFKPEAIASAAIYLASRYLNQLMPEGGGTPDANPWYQEFKVELQAIQDISQRILDLYSASQRASQKFRPLMERIQKDKKKTAPSREPDKKHSRSSNDAAAAGPPVSKKPRK